MSAPLRVLLVEDSADDAALIVRHLQLGGYDVESERVDSRNSMSTAIERKNWDLVICDYSMPNFSGSEALQLLRERDRDIPFIFVSGTIGEDTAVSALKLGAQDYVMKGNLKRLLPAIQRELCEAQERRERERLEQRLKQLERFEAIGRLAGGIAHDFNNIIGTVMGWAQMGYEEASPYPGMQQRFQKIRAEAQRAAGLTSQLLTFARRQVLQPRHLDLNQSISNLAPLLETATGAHVEVKNVLAPDLGVIRADPTQIDQALMNLYLNARDAMPSGGQLVIETRNVRLDESFCRTHPDAKPGEYVLLTVSDTGVGMDKATLDRIFEPFFTTKELGRGTGLGLATVYGVVQQHEGFIRVDTEPGKGSAFHLYFPASAGAIQARNSTPVSTLSRGTETLLIADDHEGLIEIAKEFLGACGYTLILAKNGEKAVQLFTENKVRIDLVILDVSMPLLTGPEAYRRMCELQPGLRVIFTTGHTAESPLLNSTLEAGAALLQKPYAPQELALLVRRTLDARPSAL
jgi:signal transduction histidine kinase